jgi:hypothetical protein
MGKTLGYLCLLSGVTCLLYAVKSEYIDFRRGQCRPLLRKDRWPMTIYIWNCTQEYCTLADWWNGNFITSITQRLPWYWCVLSLVWGCELRNSLWYGLNLGKEDLKAYALFLSILFGGNLWSVWNDGWVGGGGVIQEVVMFAEACLFLFATLKGFAHKTQIDCKYCERVGLQKERSVFVTFFKNRQVFVSL